MDKFVVTMREFMDRFSRDLGFPEYRILEMAADHLKSNEDFQFIVRNVHYVVPHMSLVEFFTVPTEAPAGAVEFPKTKAQKAGKAEF